MEQHSFSNIKINAALLINKRIASELSMKEYVSHIGSYINTVDNLYIFNATDQDLTDFYSLLSKHPNIEYTDMENLGEVYNYQAIMSHLVSTKCDFGLILELGYYFEEDAALTIRRYLVEHDTSKIALVAPMPLRTCELSTTYPETFRRCKGCNAVGAFFNMKIFEENSPFKLEYYQSMFDYEYCLRVRNKGYHVILAQNCILRNQNYQTIERKLLFINLSMFDYDLMDLYYQTRNRFYLWDEYKAIDKEYVKLDKKLYGGERHEMKVKDKNYRDKFYMMEEAKYDYLKKKTGKYNRG